MALFPYVLPAIKNFFAAAKLRRVRHLFFQSALGWANVSYIAFPARPPKKSAAREDFASARIYFFFSLFPHFDIFFLFGFRLLAPKGKRVGRMQIWQTKAFSTSFTFYYPQFPYAPRATITNLFFFLFFQPFTLLKRTKNVVPRKKHTHISSPISSIFSLFFLATDVPPLSQHTTNTHFLYVSIHMRAGLRYGLLILLHRFFLGWRLNLALKQKTPPNSQFGRRLREKGF